MAKSNRTASRLLSLAIALMITLPTLQSINPRGVIPNAAIAKNDVLSHELSTYFNLNEVKTPFTAKVNLGSAYSTLEPYATSPNYLGPNADFTLTAKVSTNAVVTIYNYSQLKITVFVDYGLQTNILLDLKDDTTTPLCTDAILEQYKNYLFVSCIDKDANRDSNPGNFYIYTIDVSRRTINSKNTQKQSSDSWIGERAKLVIIGDEYNKSDARLVAYAQNIDEQGKNAFVKLKTYRNVFERSLSFMADYELDLPKPINYIFGIFRYQDDFVVTGRFAMSNNSIGMAYCHPYSTNRPNMFSCDSYLTRIPIKSGLIGLLDKNRFFVLDATEKSLSLATVTGKYSATWISTLHTVITDLNLPEGLFF